MPRERLVVWCSRVSPLLDERQRRLVLGSTAEMLGRGGVTTVAEAAGVSRNTVATGAREVREGAEPSERVRRPGGGRKKATEAQPELLAALDSLVEPESRGDPMSPLRWTLKSTRRLAVELTAMGYKAGVTLVRDLLGYMDYSLQAPAKQLEGATHPDRDGQFRYVNERAGEHLAAGEPVISVDTKKKELVGAYDNGGREWQPKGTPERVNVHDFVDPEMGKAIPYGVYDTGADEGWVSVGKTADTAAFAVASIRSWWQNMGSERYPDVTRLMITADGGGSNGYRVRAWKAELARLAAETGLTITVCHLPPGTSKWNKIEHRLFSFITMNWRGRPLTSYRTIVELIGATTTKTGLTVRSQLDERYYPTGVKIPDQDFAALPVTAHDWHGEWNYTIHPPPK